MLIQIKLNFQSLIEGKIKRRKPSFSLREVDGPAIVPMAQSPRRAFEETVGVLPWQ